MTAQPSVPDTKDHGFSLIELLIVMIIIGILAAIAVPIMINQRTRATDATIKADLKSVANEIEAGQIDENKLPTSFTFTMPLVSLTHSTGVSETVRLSAGNSIRMVYVKAGTTPGSTVKTNLAGARGYCLTGTNPKGSGAVITHNSIAGGAGSGPCPS
jgi:type IV pilus assembly protein PilA